MMNGKEEEANGIFGGGTGTEADPYLIEDVEDLKTLKNYLGDESKATYNDTYFELVNDLDLSGEVWVPIGVYDDKLVGTKEIFYGQFDGNSRTIIGLHIDDNCKDYQGLFGCIQEAEKKI